MGSIFDLIKTVFKAATVPLFLILVWFFDVRPFTYLFTFIDKLLAVDLAAQAKSKGITPAVFGAIDVALLTFIYNIFTIILSKILSKPAKISIEIKDRKSNKNFIAIPFDKDKIGMQSPSHLSIKGEIEIKYAKWFFDYILRGIRISILWHPQWLSVESQINGTLQIINKQAGAIHFNFMDILSQSDWSSTMECKLSIMANSDFKRDGEISVKVEVNSKNKLIRVFFNWVIVLCVKSDLHPCNISLEKGS